MNTNDSQNNQAQNQNPSPTTTDSSQLPDLGALQNEINQVAGQAQNSASPGLAETPKTPKADLSNSPSPQTPSTSPVAGSTQSPASPQTSAANAPGVSQEVTRMAPGQDAGIMPKSSNPLTQNSNEQTKPNQEQGSVFSASDKLGSPQGVSNTQGQGVPLGLMGASKPMGATAGGSGLDPTPSSPVSNLSTQNASIGSPGLPTPQVSSPPLSGENDKGKKDKPKSSGGGIGKKIMGIVFALLLLGGLAGGGYYYYTTQVQTPQVAEVGSVCSSGPPTASVCYGKPYGYVVAEDWPHDQCGAGGGDPTKTYNLVCQNTENDWCSADCVEASGGGGGGNICTPPLSCENNGGTWNGECKFYECRYGDTNSDGKCDEGDFGYTLSPKANCQTLIDDMLNNNKCGQVDAVNTNGVYCDVEGNDCQPDKINWSCDPLPTHLECRSNACQIVGGSGSDQCSDDVDCDFHSVCEPGTNACIQQPGPGDDQCVTNSDCVPTTYTHTASAYCEGTEPKISMSWNIPGSTVADISLDETFSPRWRKNVGDGATQTAIAEDEFISDSNGVDPMPPLSDSTTYYTRVAYTNNGLKWTQSIPVITPQCDVSAVSCQELQSNIANPEVGDVVNLTCVASAGTRTLSYDFRYSIDGGDFIPITNEPLNNVASLSIEQAGEYVVQCRACDETGDATVCSPDWGDVSI